MATQFSFHSPYLPKFSKKSETKQPTKNPFRRYISSCRNISLSWSSSKSLSSIASCSDKNAFIAEDESYPSVGMTQTNEVECNRVNFLVWVLHESARSFSLAIQNLEVFRNGPELSYAWNGVDVNEWHKHTAYQVAVYALLKAAIEVEILLCHNRCNSPVYETLSKTTLILGEFVENQLNIKHPKLVEWFKAVELRRITESFIPLFKKWSVEYAGSGVAGVILAISCCIAVRKLGSGRLGCPKINASIDDSLVKLKDLSHDLVSVDRLHHLSIEAGFEDDFLSHFGKKVLPSKTIEDVEFWIGLVQEKLSLAFHRESVVTSDQTFIDKVEETTLAILGIFAYLGRETRLYLLEMNIKDMDDQIKDFLSYLECGSLYIYPELNSLQKYQLFLEVVIDEIGWLDFYAPLKVKFQYDGRRSRQHAIQAEKEIILYTVLTVCYDVFSGFAHYTNSSQQPLDSGVLSFLFQSQNLLSSCLEEYWVAYDKSGELMKFRVDTNLSLLSEAQQETTELTKNGVYQERFKGTSLEEINPVMLVEKEHGAQAKRLHERLLKKSKETIVSTTNVILMGTQLLFIDVSGVIGLIVKQVQGKKITKREKKKITRTLADIITLVPVTILMLIPVCIYFHKLCIRGGKTGSSGQKCVILVSAVGHAAILTAINKYIPSMIPSSYSCERLHLVRQLKRTKKKKAESLTVEDKSQTR